MHKVVLGLGFGDEGKGSVVDWLTENHQKSYMNHRMVVRFSGGQQAGHGVYRDNIKHVFSNFGSGTLTNVPTYWTKFCTVDPVGFMREFNALKLKGITPVIYMDKECSITTIFDKIVNQQGFYTKHGTCGTGFGETIERNENFYHLSVLDLQHNDIFQIKYNLLKTYYFNNLDDEYIDSYKEQENLFFLSCKQMLEIVHIVDSNYISKLSGYTLFFEGTQGLLLDQHYGFFPHVTRSNTGLKNVKELVLNQSPLEVYLVTRAYLTRHGNGPFPTEVLKVNNSYEINKDNTYQGQFKKTLLRTNWLNYAFKSDPFLKNENINLVITNTDFVKTKYSFINNEEQVVVCNTLNNFVLAILGELCFKPRNVYYNDSPFAASMQKFKK